MVPSRRANSVISGRRTAPSGKKSPTHNRLTAQIRNQAWGDDLAAGLGNLLCTAIFKIVRKLRLNSQVFQGARLINLSVSASPGAVAPYSAQRPGVWPAVSASELPGTLGCGCAALS